MHTVPCSYGRWPVGCCYNLTNWCTRLFLLWFQQCPCQESYQTLHWLLPRPALSRAPILLWSSCRREGDAHGTICNEVKPLKIVMDIQFISLSTHFVQCCTVGFCYSQQQKWTKNIQECNRVKMFTRAWHCKFIRNKYIPAKKITSTYDRIIRE